MVEARKRLLAWGIFVFFLAATCASALIFGDRLTQRGPATLVLSCGLAMWLAFCGAAYLRWGRPTVWKRLALAVLVQYVLVVLFVVPSVGS